LRRFGGYLHALYSLEIEITVLLFQIEWLALASVALVWRLALLLAGREPAELLAAQRPKVSLVLVGLRQEPLSRLAGLCSPVSLLLMAGRLGYFPALGPVWR
jgi:hypothetical protein